MYPHPIYIGMAPVFLCFVIVLLPDLFLGGGLLLHVISYINNSKWGQKIYLLPEFRNTKWNRITRIKILTHSFILFVRGTDSSGCSDTSFSASILPSGNAAGCLSSSHLSYSWMYCISLTASEISSSPPAPLFACRSSLTLCCIIFSILKSSLPLFFFIF